MIKDFNTRVEAAQLASSAHCNMDCRYCYIIKNSELTRIHNDIVKSIKDGSLFDKLYKLQGENLTSISFWGTEPTLTVHYITEQLDHIFDMFPKLNSLMFSTNMLSNTERIHSYINKLNEISKKLDRDIDVHIQLSLDGPKEITDKNRRPNSTEKIVQNILNLLCFISDMNINNKFNITIGFKPTMSMENIDFFINQNGIIKYFDFFENIFENIDNIIKNKKNVTVFSGCSPTLMVPGMYTQNDGKLYAKFIDAACNQKIIDLKDNRYKYMKGEYIGYISDMMVILDTLGDFHFRAHQTTCSAADSNVSLDHLNNIHLCHNSFNYTDEEYMSSIYNKNDDYDICDFDPITNKFIIENYIVNANDDYELSRLMTVTRGFHDFNTLKVSFVKLLIKELALAGQADKVYLTDDRLTTLLSIFLNKRFSCPYNNLATTKSIHHMGLSVVRLFANGAFLNIMDYISHVERSECKI